MTIVNNFEILTVVNNIRPQFQRFFGNKDARSGTQKTDAQNQNLPPIKRELETLRFVLYCLNKTCSFYFKCVSIKSFCDEAFVV